MQLEPLEAPCATERVRRTFTIGLPAGSDPSERRFPLTPEGVEMLREHGFTVKIQKGAAAPIHYTDMAYSRCGAEIVTEAEALACDIVIHLSPLTVAQAGRLRRGALLLTLLQTDRQQREALRVLLERKVIAIAVDLITDKHGNHPFADILSEIDGRAAVTMAGALLADSRHGKGILLGGIAGIGPCEVTVFGSGIAACAAARSAAGAGAVVRMFDNDVYSLRYAQRELGASVIASSLHPRVVEGALHSADVVISTFGTDTMKPFDTEAVSRLKRGVIVFDLNSTTRGALFPSLPVIDASDWNPGGNSAITTVSEPDSAPTRLCIVGVGGIVPRTAAMALTNTFTTMLRELLTCDGVTNALKLLPGLQRAAYTFLGQAVHSEVARKAGVRAVDIALYLTLS